MKKKDYLKPTVQVVKLKNQALLQTVSIGSVNNPDSFEDGGDPLNPEP